MTDDPPQSPSTQVIGGVPRKDRLPPCPCPLDVPAARHGKVYALGLGLPQGTTLACRAASPEFSSGAQLQPHGLGPSFQGGPDDPSSESLQPGALPSQPLGPCACRQGGEDPGVFRPDSRSRFWLDRAREAVLYHGPNRVTWAAVQGPCAPGEGGRSTGDLAPTRLSTLGLRRLTVWRNEFLLFV